MTSTEPRRLDIDGTFNFRPIGAELDAIVPGRLYRSDALHRLTRTGRASLADLHVESVIDLRSALDRRIGGRDRLRGTGATPVMIPIAGADRHTDPATITLPSLYSGMLTDYREEIADAIRTVARASGPVLVHCTAGKDRTGLVSALLLSVLGATDREIIDDYVLTGPNLAGEWSERMIRKVRRFRVPITDSLVEVLTGAPASAMAETLAWLRTEHGGPERYLDAIGIGADDRALLRRSYSRG